MSQTGIADYLIERLLDSGVRHAFGVPGDYVLGFFKKLEDSPLQAVNTCDEQGAGFAADAYARLNGLGVVCTTFGVGGLKVTNTTGEAFAEKVPVLVISGAPGMSERARNPMLHHKANQFDTQQKVFEELTVASASLSSPETAFAEIDRVLAAIARYKRPGYLELPRDMVSVKGTRVAQKVVPKEESDPEALAEALQEALARINAAKQPVLLVGDEIQRFGLEEQVLQLAEETNIPMAVSLMAKSVIPETHPLCLGVYAGALGNERARSYVDSCDCLVLLGVLLTDFNLGVYTAHLDQSRSIHATSERVSLGYHYFQGVTLGDFLVGLADGAIKPRDSDVAKSELAGAKSPPGPQKITVERLFQQIGGFLDDNTVLVADVGDALFGAVDVVTCRAAQFLSPAYYTSLGFAVPASIAVQLSRPALRPLAIVGDGAFQMTGMELSTAVRYGLTPIVVVLNNGGYGTERPMIDGAFNDVLRWRYHRLPEVFGSGAGFLIETEEQLHDALVAARENIESFSILDVRLAPDDISPPLRRLTEVLGKKT